MKPGPFTYHDPSSVEDLIGLLGSLEDVKLLAGGQSLMPMLNMRYVIPDHVIDLNTISGMDGIEDTGSALKFGAMTRQADILGNSDVAAKAPLLHEALTHVGHFQTRNRGTIGGSLCNLDPSAELPVAALLYEAELSVQGPEGTRTAAMKDWPLAYMTPSLDAQEVLTSITMPYWTQPHGSSFMEFARRHGDFAIVAVGCLLAVENGTITRAALALGGAQQTPYRLEAAEQALVGQPATQDTFKAAAEIAKSQEAMSDTYVQENYRQRLAGVLTLRALTQAAERAGA